MLMNATLKQMAVTIEQTVLMWTGLTSARVKRDLPEMVTSVKVSTVDKCWFIKKNVGPTLMS